jgi:hypothetical protein
MVRAATRASMRTVSLSIATAALDGFFKSIFDIAARAAIMTNRESRSRRPSGLSGF